MREIIMNGEPKVYHSDYTPKDIFDFLIDVTCQAYKETGVTLEVIEKGGYTLKKTLLGGVKRDKLIPPVVRHPHCLGEGSFDCDYILYDSLFDGKIDTEELIKTYATEDRHLKIVRVYISSAQEAPDGYHIKMDSKTIYPIQNNDELPKNLSPYDVAELIKSSYEKLDPYIMEPFLDCDFHYQSFAVFSEITSREEFMSYISGKFRIWKDDGTYPKVTISKDESVGSYVLQLNNMITEGSIPALSVSINNKGRILSFYMSAIPLPIDELLPYLKEVVGEFDNERLFKASTQSINSIGRNFDSGDADFVWLQHLALRPCCQHMSFIYKSLAVSVYIAPVYGDTIYVSRNEMAFYEQFRTDNHLTTVLLPVSLETLEPMQDGLLLNPETLQPVNLDALNAENQVFTMSSWEVTAMAVIDTCNDLFEKGYQFVHTTNAPGVYPQVVAHKPDGSTCYLIINAEATGNKDNEKTIDIQLNETYMDNEGFFINRVYSNKWNTLDFDELELLRQGGHYSNEIEMIPVSEVESLYPNIHLNISYFPQESTE